jgi:hypothetical protein
MSGRDHDTRPHPTRRDGAERGARVSTSTTPLNRLNNIRRGELRRLLLHRKVSKTEVHNKVEDILAEGRGRWTARALGHRVDLTFDEKIRLGIRSMRCTDRSEKMMKLYFRERKRERDRMRWHRSKQSFSRGLSPAANKLAEQLSAHKWMGVADIVHQGKRRRGRREAARSAVRRALKELIAADLVDEKLEARRSGGFERRMRLKKPENPALLNSSARKKAINVEVVGEASVFRPPVARPPVKYSPPHRASSVDACTSDEERAANT